MLLVPLRYVRIGFDPFQFFVQVQPLNAFLVFFNSPVCIWISLLTTPHPPQKKKLLAEKMPELLDFDKNLVHLEAASKVCYCAVIF